jgi:hypothetical protein
MFIEDVTLLAAMGPPGGGRTNITARFSSISIYYKKILISKNIFYHLFNKHLKSLNNLKFMKI